MTRLPVVSSDSNAWGTILNQFLQVGHNADGSLNSVMKVYHVDDYGADPTGASDSTTPIANARSAANSAGGGIVFYSPGTYITGNQTLYAKVHDLGAGIETTTIKLKNGANTDLFSAQTGSINLSASLGSGSTGTLYNFSISNMTLDGNLANQTSGPSYPLHFYGYDYILQNLRIRNGYTGGVLCDWNASGLPTPHSMEAQWNNIKIHDCNGIGLQSGGPHDSQFTNILIWSTGSHCLHIAPNANSATFLNAHVYAPGDVGMLIEGGFCLFSNCQSEGSNTMCVALLASLCSWNGGNIFEGASGNGLQLGQTSGNTPYSGQIQQSAGVTTTVYCGGCIIDSLFSMCTSSHGAIWFANDGGNNQIKASIYQTSGTGVTGTISNNTSYWITVNGLTPDGTVGKSGGVQLASQSGGVMFGGSVASILSGTAPDPGASGTITTSGVGVARVNPTGGSRAGCILQAGIGGQEVWVINEHASNTITFAASGTSHVADGVADVIAANSARKYIYDTGTALWYKAS